MSLRCPRGSLCVVLPDPTGASAAVRALLAVLSGGSGPRHCYRCEGSLALLGRPARDWLPADLLGEVTYLGDREELLELPAGAVAGWGCGDRADDGAQAQRFFAAAEVSGAQATLRSLPGGLATFLTGRGPGPGPGPDPDRDPAALLTAGAKPFAASLCIPAIVIVIVNCVRLDWPGPDRTIPIHPDANRMRRRGVEAAGALPRADAALQGDLAAGLDFLGAV